MNKAVLQHLLLISVVFMKYSDSKQPNFLVIIADDLGWDDVGFHGSPQANTPNLDKLAANGVILMDHYVNPICTPTRSALLTGKYPINNGMQSNVIMTHEAWGLGLKEKLLPQHLKRLGYKNYLVGKWHLGFFAEEYTPLNRGFDEFYGCYAGRGDYYDHSSESEDMIGLDLRDGHRVDRQENGTYSTYLFTEIANRMIRNHDPSKPMFMILSYQAVHSANTKDPLQAPPEMVSRYEQRIENVKRRKYLGMVSAMDAGIGKVYRTLSESGLLENTIIFFTTDNGAASDGFDDNQGSNFPLRGMKTTLFEGGVRATSFVYSPLLIDSPRVSHDLMHVIDWFATILKLAGGKLETLNGIDGLDMWPVLSMGKPSEREELVLNIDPDSYENFALRYKRWKVIYEGFKDSQFGWYHPPSFSRKAYTNLQRKEEFLTSMIHCPTKPVNLKSCRDVCLFDLKLDPCEMNDLSEKYPHLLQTLLRKVRYYKKRMAEPLTNNEKDDKCDPKNHGGVWKPWVILTDEENQPRRRHKTHGNTYGQQTCVTCPRYHRRPGALAHSDPVVSSSNQNISIAKKRILSDVQSLFSK